MSANIKTLSGAAFQGDWNPLFREAEKARGKHWAEEANCINRDIGIFFPKGDHPREDPHEVAERLALSIVRPMKLCASCPLPVAARCLVDSIEHDDEWGIRGGLLASERSQLRATWQQRVDDKVVERALRGATAPLSTGEREAVIARFAADSSVLDAAAVARALGVTRDYLFKLAWRARKKSRPAPAVDAA
ncbi:WhiB family transcriptional regulator [Streptomyces sp. NPDC002055]|uniref:WhiB family transcriptional regulator n=1 Tax=Streptomyces sp. NPDC002055 TaxID=3154534 RepID=UPI00332405B6